MTQLEVALAARAHVDGVAKRMTLVRHRRLMPAPLAVVLWQLGAEPFSAAALGYGIAEDGLHMSVAGEPRNRDLAFAALLRFARWFNPLFEAPDARRETVLRGSYQTEVATSAPQVIVANRPTADLLARLGRRLAYLPTDGPRPANPQLVRLGQHLRFLGRHLDEPGQQLIVVLTEFLQKNWATPQTPLERASLAALDAFIEPPAGLHGFFAAAQAERLAIGPEPAGEDDELVMDLVEALNSGRRGSTDPARIAPLLRPIEAHYTPLVQRTWRLLWHCLWREMAWPEAASVSRRWEADREAYTWHMDWIHADGRRRISETARQAAMTMRRLEQATARIEAEEACDDPLRMIPYLLDQKAVEGDVVRVDLAHRERAAVNLVRRPLVTVLSENRCLMPLGKILYWSERPGDKAWVVHHLQPTADGASLVTLKFTNSTQASVPALGQRVCFSIHSTATRPPALLPQTVPWTHIPSNGVGGLATIEEEPAS